MRIWTFLTIRFLILDIDSVDLDNDDAYADINVVSSTLKLWFRELPDPLFTYSLYSNFMEAAREWGPLVSPPFRSRLTVGFGFRTR